MNRDIMKSTERRVMFLRLLALLNELPDDATVEMQVRGLPRADFDRLPGDHEANYGSRHSPRWMKQIVHPYGVTVELWTDEAPPGVVGYPPRPGELRVIEGGRNVSGE